MLNQAWIFMTTPFFPISQEEDYSLRCFLFREGNASTQLFCIITGEVFMENIDVLIHKLSNVLALVESSINRVKNADKETLDKRWLFMKEVIVATGRDRLDSEIVLYKNTQSTIGKALQATYKSVDRQLSEANGYYKAMFDLLNEPDDCSEENRNITLTNGNRLIIILKETVNTLEKVKIESR